MCVLFTDSRSLYHLHPHSLLYIQITTIMSMRLNRLLGAQIQSHVIHICTCIYGRARAITAHRGHVFAFCDCVRLWWCGSTNVHETAIYTRWHGSMAFVECIIVESVVRDSCLARQLGSEHHSFVYRRQRPCGIVSALFIAKFRECHIRAGRRV